MTGRFAPDHSTALLQHGEHVAIADLRASELDSKIPQRDLETEVAHDGADNRTAQHALAVAIPREDVQQLIAVDQVAALVDHHDAVAVAIERHAYVRSHARDRELQQIRPSGAAAVVDVATVR